MIRGMVERLATRLATSGGDADEWAAPYSRLYGAAQPDKAKDALASARKALAGDAEAGQRTRRAGARTGTRRLTGDPQGPPTRADRRRARGGRLSRSASALYAMSDSIALFLTPERGRGQERCRPGTRLRRRRAGRGRLGRSAATTR